MNTKTRILVVEDETIVALDIKSALKKLGHEVVGTATNYDDAIKKVKEYDPDIILMDINLENSKDGIETVTDIQKIKFIPVIYLTAFTDDATVERAIKTNPIAYLNKPFRRDEIKSSILLAVHKMNPDGKFDNDDNFKELGFGYYFDMKNIDLYYKSLPIKLSVKEREFLRILVEADGQIVPMEKIEFILWPEGTVSESALRTVMYRIRSKLEHKLIETIPSFGCKLITKF